MKKTLLITLAILLFQSLFCKAQEVFEYDGINYSIISNDDKTCYISSAAGKTGQLNLHETVYYNNDAYKVIRIGSWAFYRCPGLIGDIIIPNSITEIDDFAFYQCSGFTGNLSLGKSIKKIGRKAFNECSGLNSDLIIPDQVESIGESAFEGCSNLTGNLKIGESVHIIGKRAFYGCSRFNGDLIIPNSVKEIGEYAFNTQSIFQNLYIDIEEIKREYFYRDNLDINIDFSGSLTIGNNVKIIGKESFKSKNFKELSLGNSIETIGEAAFEGCKGFMGELIIPNSVITIENDAFRSCEGFDKLVIGNSVKTIGDYSFAGFKGLTELIIGESVETIGFAAFFQCENITGTLRFPDTLTSIGQIAFFCCNGITDLVIPDSVEQIGKGAFNNCIGLQSVILGSSLKYLGDDSSIHIGVFEGCESLKSVICKAITPPICYYSNFDSSIYPNVPLYVNNESIEAYKQAIDWEKFFNIKPLSSLYDFSINYEVKEGEVTGHNLKIGETRQFFIEVGGEKSELEINWAVSPENMASIDEKGLLTALKEGEVKVLATPVDAEDYSAEYKATISGTILYGDANDDNGVDVADVITVGNHIVSQPNYNFCFVNSDVITDKKIDEADLTETINISMGRPSSRSFSTRSDASENEFMGSLLAVYEDDLKGMNIKLTISDNIGFVTFGADFILPEDMKITGVETGNDASQHMIIYNVTENNELKLILFSLTNSEFCGSESHILTIHAESQDKTFALEGKRISATNRNAESFCLELSNRTGTSGINETKDNQLSIFASSGRLNIFNAEGLNVEVYSFDGKLIKSFLPNNNKFSREIENGIYIVRCGNKTFKINVK